MPDDIPSTSPPLPPPPRGHGTRRAPHPLLLTPKNQSAVDGCLAGACQGLGFDIAALGKLKPSPPPAATASLGSNNTDEPVTVTEASDREEVEGVAHGDFLLRQVPTTLSRSLCSRVLKEKVPLWFTPAHPGTPLHAEMPINTAVVMPIFSFETQTEFFVLLYAYNKLESSSAKIAYLRFLCKAAVTATCLAFLAPPHSHACDNPAAATINDVSVRCSQPDLPQHFLPWTDLQHCSHLVEGGTSLIYTADYNGQAVIAKILREDCAKQDIHIKEMRNEIELMQSFNHPHIANYIGSGIEPRPFIVMEMLAGGSLNQRLGHSPKYYGFRRHSFHFKDTRKAFPFPTLLKYAHQLADALRYLHHEAIPGFSVVHRDLKPDNIGFTADGTLKIFDLGLGKLIPQNVRDRANYSMTGDTGSIRYMAPEVALREFYDEKVDVYSYSLIAWEMATLMKPFESYGKADFFSAVVRGGERPKLNRKWPEAFSSLLESCWQRDPAKRPAFTEVVTVVEELMREQQQQQSTVSSSSSSGGAYHPMAKMRPWHLTHLTDRKSSWF